MKLAWKLLCATCVLAACEAPNGVGPLPQPLVEEPAVLSEAPAPVTTPAASNRKAPRARAGVVTAGDIDDTLNLNAFLRYQSRTAKALQLPRADLSRPVLARLQGPGGKPAPGVRFTLRTSGAVEPFYTGYSGVDGAVTVFPSALGAGRPRAVELRAFSENGQAYAQTLRTSGQRRAVALPFDGTWTPDFLDLAFVVDTTGSMGDELDWLTRELSSFVADAKRAAPGVDIRYGLVVYKAPGDRIVVKNYGFTKSQGQMRRWLNAQTPSGGSGGPEVVARALETGVALNWRRGRGERLLFQIGDEPPLANRTGAYLRAVQKAAADGVQLFGLGASGVEEHLEYLMRQAAVQTSGRYLFLTDDSGVGLAHGEPAISCYRVTRLNGLISRVLRSELTGRRIEAANSAVIRQVGSYRAGVCEN